MATATATYQQESWLTYSITIDYTINTGSLTINSITGSHSYATGDEYDCTKNLTHTLNFPGGSGSIVTKLGSASSGHGTGWKCNNGTWVWDISAGSTTFSGVGTGNLTLTIASNTGINYWPSNVTFNFGSITIPSPVTTPTISDVTIGSIGRDYATASFYVINNGGAAIVDNYIDASLTNFGTAASTIVGTSGTFYNLTPNTYYYVRANASNGTYRGWGNVGGFKTTGNAPSITSVTTSPTTNSCDFTINVSYDTNDWFSSRTIEYGTTTGYGSSTTGTQITGLSQNTTYYYRITIVSAQGRSTTYTGSFKTLEVIGKVRIKINGTYKTAYAYIKVNGVWKYSSTYMKVNNQWKKGE